MTAEEGPRRTPQMWGPRRRVARAPRLAALAAATAVGVAATACVQVDVPESLSGPEPMVIPPPDAAPGVDTSGCDPDTVTHSLRPDAAAIAAAEGGGVAPGSYMAEIQDRGRLRVGVDTATLQFSSVNPFTGEFEGFDVEIAREIAFALFGTRDADRIELVAIPYSERVDVLAAQPEPLVDLVINTFTINCARDVEIDFSTEYFTSTQKLLVRSDSEARSIEDMTAEHRVCATAINEGDTVTLNGSFTDAGASDGRGRSAQTASIGLGAIATSVAPARTSSSTRSVIIRIETNTTPIIRI